MELLAPVGSKEALTAAVENGADAVYMAGKAFGARHYAPNFDDDELAEAVRFAHMHGVKVYITVNTLIDERDIEHLVKYLRYLYLIAVDAVIVQDMAVAAIVQKIIPAMPLHGSTQMTVHNSAGVKLLEECGFSRVVLARELSMDEIAEICKSSKMEIEVFVHGALCVSYSGQCLLSSIIGGRSGNRGRCAQPCRLPYSLINSKGENVLAGSGIGEYLLSPKDLNTVEMLSDFKNIGVTSLKIEGRMKNPEYVAIVVSSYRKALSAPNIKLSDSNNDLNYVFNRGFTTAYLENNKDGRMINDKRPNNNGAYIGSVISCDKQQQTIYIKLTANLTYGDIVECRTSEKISTTVGLIKIKGKVVSEAIAGDEVEINMFATDIKKHDKIFKTFDVKRMDKARGTFANLTNRKRILIDASIEAHIGYPFKIILSDKNGNIGVGLTNFIVEKAKKVSLSDDTVYSQLNRLGNTEFMLQNVNMNIEPYVMVPISEINDARRQAVNMLEEAILGHYSHPRIKDIEFKIPKTHELKAYKPDLTVSVDGLDELRAAISNGADRIIFGGSSFAHKHHSSNDYKQAIDLCHSNGVKIILNTSRILKDKQINDLNKDLELTIYKPDAVAVGNLGMLHFMRQNYPQIPLHGELSLNVFNSISAKYFQDLGLVGITLSPELNLAQLKSLIKKLKIKSEIIVHGYLTLMISEYCIPGSFQGKLDSNKCCAPCLDNKYWLRDRKGELFRIMTDQYCRMHILNSKELNMAKHIPKLAQMGFNSLRIEAKGAGEVGVGKLTAMYRQLLTYGIDENLAGPSGYKLDEHKNITRGHYFRGV